MIDDVDPGRAARAAIALSDGDVTIAPNGEEPGVFAVSSFSGDGVYRVTLEGPPSCTCADSVYNGTTFCKHTLAVALARGLS